MPSETADNFNSLPASSGKSVNSANSSPEAKGRQKPFDALQKMHSQPSPAGRIASSKGKTNFSPLSSAKTKPNISKTKPVVLKEKEVKDNLLTKLQDWLNKFRQATAKKETVSQTNLVKDQAVVFIDWRHYLFSLLNSFLLAAIILGIFYGYLLLLGESKMQEVKENAQKLKELNSQITKVENSMEDVFSFQKKIKLVKLLINQHIYWTNFFIFLEKNTLPNVHYASFNGNIDGHYKLEAQTDSFTSIANQLLIFKQNPYVLTVKTSGGDISYTQALTDNNKQNEENADSSNGSLGQENIMKPSTQSTVSFDLELNIKPDIFFE